MTGINTVTLMGNLTKDPEMRYTTTGKAVCNLRMAVNRRYKVGEEWKEEATFLTVVAWNQQAESCSEHLKKGSAIAVLGRLQSRSWEKEDKSKAYSLDVVAERVIFLDRKEGKVDEPDHGEPEAPRTSEEDIPF